MKNIKTPIDEKMWIDAQTEEIKHHINESIDISIERYRTLYSYYFKYLGIDNNLKGQTILEIGPARISSLLFCENYSKSYIVEPTLYPEVNYLYENKSIEFIRETYETCLSPKVDEIWLFNVLQHIIDPDGFIKKAKESAKIIRFFEPINTSIEIHHPFSFTEEDYIHYFGDSVKIYDEQINGFHTSKCVYGTYIC